MQLLPFFRLHWQWLRWVLLVLAIILAGLILTQTVDYATAWYRRRHLRAEQAQATGAHAQQQASAAARYATYRLDSVRHATERQALLRHLRNLENLDDSLSKNRPARVPLPAWDKLPRE